MMKLQSLNDLEIEAVNGGAKSKYCKHKKSEEDHTPGESLWDTAKQVWDWFT